MASNRIRAASRLRAWGGELRQFAADSGVSQEDYAAVVTMLNAYPNQRALVAFYQYRAATDLETTADRLELEGRRDEDTLPVELKRS
jgi:hypothetical protein